MYSRTDTIIAVAADDDDDGSGSNGDWCPTLSPIRLPVNQHSLR